MVAIPEEVFWLCHQLDAVYRPWDPRIDLLPNGVLTVMLDLSPQFRTGRLSAARGDQASPTSSTQARLRGSDERTSSGRRS